MGKTRPPFSYVDLPFTMHWQIGELKNLFCPGLEPRVAGWRIQWVIATANIKTFILKNGTKLASFTFFWSTFLQKSWTAKITAFGKIICTKNLLQYWTRENNFETGETTKFCKNRLIFFWSSTAKLLNTKGFFKWAIPNLFLVILVFSTANN